LYRPSSSMMVDYTDFEDLKILREKRKNVCFPITSPAAHHHRERERRNFFFREILIIIFISLIEVCHHNEIFENS